VPRNKAVGGASHFLLHNLHKRLSKLKLSDCGPQWINNYKRIREWLLKSNGILNELEVVWSEISQLKLLVVESSVVIVEVHTCNDIRRNEVLKNTDWRINKLETMTSAELKVTVEAEPFREVLPKRGLIFQESSPQLVLCKPKLLPLKSFTLVSFFLIFICFLIFVNELLY
jgi:hypothetical protein